MNHQSLWIIYHKKLMQAELCIIMIKPLSFQHVFEGQERLGFNDHGKNSYGSPAVHGNIICYGVKAGNGKKCSSKSC